MGPLILAGFLFLVVVLLFAMFARGGPKEPESTLPGQFVVRDRIELEDLTRRLIQRLGLRIERRDDSDGRGIGFLAIDPVPIVGQRIYVEMFALPQGERVTEAEVQAAIDAAKDDAVHKVVLVSPGGFSDEAILAARDSIVELLDADALSLALSPRGPLPTWRHARGLT